MTFSSKLDWGPYIISIAKTASRKIGALICSMKVLSSEVALYLYKSTICPYMEYCFHVWAGAPWHYLELLEVNMQVGICLEKNMQDCHSFTCCFSQTRGSSTKCVCSLSLFCRYYFGRCSSELAQLVPLPFSRGRSTFYSDRLHDFSVSIPRCYRDVVDL